MAKLTGPLMSIDASGSFAKTLTFSKWKGINYVRQRVIPTYSRTTDQGLIRDLIKDASEAWRSGATVGAVTINSAYKLEFNTAASGFAYSGFNLYMRNSVSKNGGSAYDGSFAAPTSSSDF